MRDEQFQVRVKKPVKKESPKKAPIGFYLEKPGVGTSAKPKIARSLPKFNKLSLGGFGKIRSSLRAAAQKRNVQKMQKATTSKAVRPVTKPTNKSLLGHIPKRQAKVTLAEAQQAATRSKKRRRTISKEYIAVACVLMVGVALGVGGLIVRQSKRSLATNANNGAQSGGKTAVLGTQTGSGGTPDFTTVKPAANPVQISFDAERRIAVFQDTVSGVAITITEQPYPDTLKKTDNGLEALAKSLNDYESYHSFGTQSKGMIHVANLKSGKQTLIFTVGDVMVFVNSSQEIAEEQWAAYLESLL